jgi:glucose/arabinose dehydrogenase
MRNVQRSAVVLLVSTALAATSASAQSTCDGIAPAGSASLVAVEVATGLLGRPDFAVAAPGDRDRLFILEQDGFVLLKKRGDAPTVVSTFLDIHTIVSTLGSEMGLLGLAFDPDYATTGRFYVNYTERVGGQQFTVVARYTVTADPDVADPASELRILRFRQPQTNHNGGQVEFGPDGYLYVWTGDGGGADDVGSGHATCGNGQSKTTLLGKTLRIDVRGIAPSSLPPDCGAVGGNYTIPTDNPIDDGLGGNCDEIFAWGLRNPWRNAFDAQTGELYVADVGQNCTEEVNFVPSPGNGGQNFGWRVMEGAHCFNTTATSNCNPPAQSCTGSPPCHDASLTDPVLTFDHGGLNECAITGGFVYRGCKMPALSGTYFYGDYCAGFVRSLVMSGGVPTNLVDWTAQLDPGGALPFGLGSFGRDTEGEIYVVSLGGDVWKIVPPLPGLEVSAPGAADQLLLSKTGDWTWQDLHRETDHPVTAYRVYSGTPNGSFSCIHKATEPRWAAGGDPAVPAAGAFFAYVVTAVNADSQETATGAAGTFDASGCP